MKRVLLVILVVALVLFSGQIVSAEEYGCCCSPDLENGYDYPIEIQLCQGQNDTFDNTITDGELCRDACVDICPETSCGGPVSDCLCGTKQIGSDEKLCCAGANSEYSPSPVGIEQCELACEDDLSYSITGTVKDSGGNILKNAYVRVGTGTPVRTGDDGSYELTTKKSAALTITAEKGGCSAQTKTIENFNADFVHNFFLICDGLTDTCTEPKTCCRLNQKCVNNAGQEVYSLGPLDCAVDKFCYEGCDCVDLPDVDEVCTDGCYNVINAYCYNERYTYYDLEDPVEYSTYCNLCSPDAQCADLPCEDNQCNGVCDPNCGPDEDPDCGNTCDFAGIPSVCTASGFITPEDNLDNLQIYCANCWNFEYCGVEFSETCDNGQWDSNVEDCEEEVGCDPGFSCTESCLCEPDECMPFGFPEIEEIRMFDRTPGVLLNWVMPDDICLEDIDKFEILRCSGANCAYPGGYSRISNSLETGSRTFEDVDLEPETNYCYVVSAYYRHNSEEFASMEVCITTGNEECMNDQYDSFCMDGSVYYCEAGNNNQAVPGDSCSGGGYCYQGENGAECKGTAECDKCNSVYGMFMAFSLNNINIDYSSIFEDRVVPCSHLEEASVCYGDTTKTSVDKFYQCSTVGNCYDYHSKNNCESYPCGQFDPGDCEWKAFQGGEQLGLGVCVPTDIERQNCGLCNQDNDIFPVCTEEVCSAFGSCYFDSENCLGEGDARCDMFNNKDDCIGTPGTQFDLYHINNRINTLSDDYFDLGKCKWDGSQCYRDADDNSDSWLVNPDCEEAEGDYFDCPKDFEAPVTSLALQPGKIFGASVTIGFSVEDDRQPPENLDTYFCFSYERGCSDKNSTELEWVDTAYQGYFIMKDFEYVDDYAFNNKSIEVHYFSKDSSENLELMNLVDVVVDLKRPSFAWNYSVDSYLLGNDVWRSDMNVTIDFDEPVTCSIYLDEDGSAVPGQSALQGKRSQNFILRFYELPDSNNYKLMLECFDDHSNPTEITEIPIVIEGDKSITNVQPDHMKFNTAATQITLSLETVHPATCKYSADKRKYSEMEGTFETLDGKYHYKPMQFQNSEIYMFYTACEITYTGSNGQYTEITEDNAGDRILFSIDNVAPTTVITRMRPAPPGEDMDFSKFYESVSMLFECRDQKLQAYGWDGSFGCGENSLYFCEHVGDPSGTCAMGANDNSVIIDLSFQEDYSETHKYMFYSQDLGGNKETQQTRILGIDNIKSDLNMTLLRINGQTSKEVNSIGYGIYNVKVDSAKKIGTISRFSVVQPKIQMLDFSVNDNNLSFSGLFEVSETPEFYNKKGTVTFEVQIEDENGISSFASFDYEFDTTKPDAPLLYPIFSDELSYLNYPFRYYPGTITLDDGKTYVDTYFISDPDLFVTGTTSESGVVKLYAAQSDIDYQSTTMVYDQSSTNNIGSVAAKDQQELVSYKNANKENTTIFLDNLVPLSTWEVGEYFSFDEARKNYGNYGKFYKITAMSSNSDGHAVIEFTPGLEKDYSGIVYLYDKEHMDDWFGIPMNFEYTHSGNNAYTFKAKITNERNINVSTEPINVFFDSEKPFITSISPIPGQGVITDRYKKLEIEISEHEAGSGVRLDSANFIIQKEDGSIRTGGRTEIEYINTSDGLRRYKLTYDPVNSWENMAYLIIVELEDYAGNKLDGKDFLPACDEVDCTWEIIIDNGAPSRPELVVEKATDINPDLLGRWYTDNGKPVFWLNSTLKQSGAVEQLNIILDRVEFESGPTNAQIPCVNTAEKNVFKCEFDRTLSEGVYRFKAYLKKDLENGNFSSETDYDYTIIVDQTPPVFNLSLQTPSKSNYIKPDDQFGVLANIKNTEYELIAEISVGDQIITKVPEIDENKYLFFMDEEVKWQTTDGIQDINIKIKDYAGHVTEQTISVIIDNSTPVIQITNITAERIAMLSENNLVIGTAELTIQGKVPADTNKLCHNYGGEDCLLRCTVGETTGCIRKDNTFTFEIILLIPGEEGKEIEKTIVLTIKDLAAHESSLTLIIVVDQLVPAIPTVDVS
ncbi:MAG: carboxypeptidase-like regulatory domain-containing protein [archaeon]